MSEDMGKRGYVQGEMSPTVKDYQMPRTAYAEQDFNKTTQYIERSDKRQNEMASDVRKQDYKGRYS